MPKTDAKIREDVEVFDMVERWGGWAVVAGVVAEFVFAFVFRAGKSPFERWTPAVADALIALGIITEIYFAKLSGDRRDELDRRSSEKVAIANARANEARLETERIKSQFGWRTLTGVQMEHLTDALARMPGSVTFVYVSGDAESSTFVSLLKLAFMHAHWQVSFQAAFFKEISFGLRIPAVVEPGASPISFPAYELVRGAFREAEIPFDDMPIPEWDSATMWTDWGTVVVPPPEGHIFGQRDAWIYVGPKVLPWAPDGTVARTQSAKPNAAEQA